MSNSGVYNNIIAVDDDDNVIEAMPKSEAIEKGYNCRASRAFVFNESGKVLLQRRSKNVSRPLLLDHSMAGHVDAGETYLMAAERELREELDIHATQYPLVEVEKPFLVHGFYGAMYKVVVPDDLAINYDQEEVAEVIWFTPEEVDRLLVEKRDECTLGLVDSWTRLRDRLISL